MAVDDPGQVALRTPRPAVGREPSRDGTGNPSNAVGFRHRDTPLHVAVLHGHTSVVKLLMAHGADPSIENMLHKTALDLAQEKQQTGLAAILTNPASAKQ